MAYLRMKGKLFAKMNLTSKKVLPPVNLVEHVPKLEKKKVKKNKSIQQLAKFKADNKKKKLMLPSADVELPKPPAGTSTARRLQDPRHSDVVRGLVNVPSLQEMKLKEGEAKEYYGKMLDVTTRGLSATSGSVYYRYEVVHVKYL